MSSSSHKKKFQNRLLTAANSADLALLTPHLEAVALPRRTRLEFPNRSIETIYFLEKGIASVVGAIDPKTQIEIGIIGDEGMTGLAVLHDCDRSPYSTYMQVGGEAYQIRSGIVRDAVARSASLRALFLRFTQVFLVQTSQTAICNARATVEMRLARWLLMAQDRVHGNAVPLTHEFLAMMMGARRPGVTEAVNVLSQEGLLRGGRGSITILDRPGLEIRAGHFYGTPEGEYDRLLR